MYLRTCFCDSDSFDFFAEPVVLLISKDVSAMSPSSGQSQSINSIDSSKL